MALPDLFLKDTTGFDESLTKLPQDMDLWSEKIITIIKQKIPEAKELKISISFLKQDEEMGVATGAATMFDKKINKTVYLPIIVKNFTMYPLDVMMVGNDSTEGGVDVVPFDLDAFRETLENSSPFGALAKPMDRLKQMYMNPAASTIHPPTYRHVYAGEGGAILTAIKGDVDKEDVETLKEDIKENKDKLKGYDKNSNLGTLKKAIDVESEHDDEDGDVDAGDALKVKVAFIRKVAANTSETVTVGGEVFTPTKVLSKIPAHTESENDELKFEAITDNVSAVEVAGDTKSMGRAVDIGSMEYSFAVTSCEDLKGLTHRGVFFKSAVNPFFGRRSGPMFVNSDFYSNDHKGNALINTDDTDTKKYLQFSSRIDALQTGMTIALHATTVAKDLEKNMEISIPLKIDRVDAGAHSINALCSDELGQKFIINAGKNSCREEVPTTSGDSKQIFGSISKENGMTKLYVNSSTNFIILGRSIRMAGAPSSVIKTASRSGEATKVRVLGRSDSTFALRGGQTEKMASILKWDHNNLKAEEASFILASKDCPLDKIASALKIAGSNIGETAIYGLKPVMFKVAEIKDDLKDARRSIAKEIKCNLFKEASSIADGQVVDSVLSLNFINESNIGKFINFIPLLKQSAGALARLVLASRLGVEELSNNDVTKAMQSLTNVIKSLEKMKGMNEKNAHVKVASISKIEQPAKEGISFLDFL